MTSSGIVVVVTGDPVPPMNTPVSGAAMRAWGLGEGLRMSGFDVIYALHREVPGDEGPYPQTIRPFQSQTFMDLLREIQPQVVVFQHWPLLLLLPERPPWPVALDFHGPLLLEMAYQQRADYSYFLGQKIAAISRADFVTCAGYHQQHYFRAWMIAAGFDVRDGKPAVIPISCSPDLPQRSASDEMTFVFGGHFLPWQDPSIALFELVQVLERAGKGKLLMFGGQHPGGKIPGGVYTGLIEKLATSPRVQIRGMVTREQLLREYSEARVAVDIMKKNPERELAFTTRTVEYLWCGLAVVYHDYADLSPFIAGQDAGWVLDPENATALHEVFCTILDNPGLVEQKRAAAQSLVRNHFTWDKTIGPLADFCREPYRLLTTNEFVASLPQRRLFEATSDSDSVGNSHHDAHLHELGHEVRRVTEQLTRLQQENERLLSFEQKIKGLLPYKVFRRCKRLLQQSP